MTTGFEWDPAKRESNLGKHGIDFVDAVEVFRHFSVSLADPRRPDREKRIVTTGLAERAGVGRLDGARRQDQDHLSTEGQSP